MQGFLFFGGLWEFADDSEADHFSIGEPPFGFWDLGVSFLPVGAVWFTSREFDVFGFVVEVSSGDGAFTVWHDDPFGGVSEAIVERPRVGFEAGGFVCNVFGVIPEPGVVFEGFWFGFCSSTGGVFPFGRGGEAIFFASFFGEPLAEGVGRGERYSEGGEAGMSVAPVGGAVGFGGTDFEFNSCGLLFLGEVESVGKDVVNVPGDFGLRDRELLDFCRFAISGDLTIGEVHHFELRELAGDGFFEGFDLLPRGEGEADGNHAEHGSVYFDGFC